MGAEMNVNWRNATPEKIQRISFDNFPGKLLARIFWNFSGVPRPTRLKALLTKIRTLRR
jgi:hypothetical protein